MKRILIFICLLCLLSLTVYAKSNDVFYVHGSSNTYVGEILGMTEDELKTYVEQNNITYLAVNKDNTKQIKRIEFANDFSKRVQSFLALKDDEILTLAEDLSGIPNAKGEIVERDKYKFLKVTAKTTDSGGEYILTQYITVDECKNQIINFYTDINAGTDYIEEYFNSQLKEMSLTFKVISIIGTILFSVLALVVLIAIIKDTFFKEKIIKNK